MAAPPNTARRYGFKYARELRAPATSAVCLSSNRRSAHPSARAVGGIPRFFADARLVDRGERLVAWGISQRYGRRGPIWIRRGLGDRPGRSTDGGLAGDADLDREIGGRGVGNAVAAFFDASEVASLRATLSSARMAGGRCLCCLGCRRCIRARLASDSRVAARRAESRPVAPISPSRAIAPSHSAEPTSRRFESRRVAIRRPASPARSRAEQR